jgi:hypothetical protein
MQACIAKCSNGAQACLQLTSSSLTTAYTESRYAASLCTHRLWVQHGKGHATPQCRQRMPDEARRALLYRYPIWHVRTSMIVMHASKSACSPAANLGRNTAEMCVK